MKYFTVYILECADASFYTGITSNLASRIAIHQSGKTRGYTSSRLPVILVWYKEFIDDPSQAIIWEKRIKGWSRRKKKALINGDWDKMVQYSKNYTEYNHKID
ncbi:excinuclease ABC subunit C [Nonlabens sp. YIK11]|uniref:GIY-YIG nuclease family protein n=1 Tax=Nonlabens sp. YIK11 TaxID=1453349 RepID=UPI0006DCDCFB|nr:GIY-YIG nuclease family protein [Nonlabens sp. YIK11]KQC34132.1 excinuclease ABC subunit C [Nonlabens sp. YIK11]